MIEIPMNYRGSAYPRLRQDVAGIINNHLVKLKTEGRTKHDYKISDVLFGDETYIIEFDTKHTFKLAVHIADSRGSHHSRKRLTASNRKNGYYTLFLFRGMNTDTIIDRLEKKLEEYFDQIGRPVGPREPVQKPRFSQPSRYFARAA